MVKSSLFLLFKDDRCESHILLDGYGVEVS